MIEALFCYAKNRIKFFKTPVDQHFFYFALSTTKDSKLNYLTFGYLHVSKQLPILIF